ncbi:MAG: MazG nucleotide pyrophosphohydrolase domain protein [Candidatus Bathyarchaeota archaeon BA1]|nr:MAG: MazG nucleotide pyrophosphohydrolase domain protein [Candidatus Bathyarchaeota archaeon BA1]
MAFTFRKAQDWVESFERARGWADRPPEEKLICLQEEVGELARAIKLVWSESSKLIKKGISQEEARKKALTISSNNVAEEIADCIVYLLSIANKFNIDIDSCLREKMKTSLQRKWTTEHHLKTGFK